MTFCQGYQSCIRLPLMSLLLIRLVDEIYCSIFNPCKLWYSGQVDERFCRVTIHNEYPLLYIYTDTTLTVTMPSLRRSKLYQWRFYINATFLADIFTVQFFFNFSINNRPSFRFKTCMHFGNWSRKISALPFQPKEFVHTTRIKIGTGKSENILHEQL